MPSVDERFLTSISKHAALPYLFVGSGISLRYLGLPTWSELLDIFARQTKKSFDYYLASSNGSLPAAASQIAEEFHDVWWFDDGYSDQRGRATEKPRARQSALKFAVADYINSRQILGSGTPGIESAELRAELDSLKSAVIDGVITTNYDSLPEQLFPQFPVYVGQQEILLSDAQFVAETYQIHGSVTNPESLVITEEDYEQFQAKNHYLTAKLLTIFAEHPVVFVGYSLNDPYLAKILDDIVTAVGPERADELGDRMYFVEWNGSAGVDPTMERSSMQRESARLPITRIETNSFKWIWDVLGKLKRPFPAHVLRELRLHVYELVAHPDPSQSREVVRAVPIDSEDAEGYRVVFGVGAFSQKDLDDLSQIGRPISREDIEQDVLGIRARPLDAANVLSSGIPEGIRPASNSYLPVFKYLSEVGRVDKSTGNVDYEGLEEIISAVAKGDLPSKIGPQSVARFNREVRGNFSSPTEFIESDLALYFQLEAAVLLDTNGYDLEELREFLLSVRKVGLSSYRSSYMRAVCHYDAVKYRG